MFNEHLILKALCHIIWNWHLLVECLVNFMLCACSSPSDLSLCSASQSLSISKSQSSNSAQILKSTEISWNFFRSSGLSPEVPDFEFFHEIFSYPFIFISYKTTPFIIQNPLPVSLSIKTL